MAELTGARWGSGAVGTAATVTWSFAQYEIAALSTTYGGYVQFDSTISLQYRDAVREAFKAWEEVCGLDFVEVADSKSANIRLGNEYIDGAVPGSSSVLAICQWWTGGSGSILSAQIFFDVDAYSSGNFYGTAVHEIGHAIGLDHSTVSSAIMYGYLNAQNRAGQLTQDDLSGAQALYGIADSVPNILVATTLKAAHRGIMRQDLSDAEADALASAFQRAGTTLDEYVSLLVDQAADSTVPALIVYDFVYGNTPSSAKLDSLTEFAYSQVHSTVYQATANPWLGGFEALGLGLSETTELRQRSEGQSDHNFIINSYVEAFGRAPTDGQEVHFQSQLDYFETLYASVGLSASTAHLRAQGAVLGQMLGFAAREEGNPYARGAYAFLIDAADGQTTYESDLTSLGLSGESDVLYVGRGEDSSSGF